MVSSILYLLIIPASDSSSFHPFTGVQIKVPDAVGTIDDTKRRAALQGRALHPYCFWSSITLQFFFKKKFKKGG